MAKAKIKKARIIKDTRNIPKGPYTNTLIYVEAYFKANPYFHKCEYTIRGEKVMI
jgi:hypothetical protein